MPKVLAFPKILPFQKFELANQNNRMVMWLFRLCQSFYKSQFDFVFPIKST